ncbi:MAG: outer membrane beta-barrel protein [Terriglobales bacterium]
MSSHSKSHGGLVAVVLLATFAVLFSPQLAAAQEQSPPKVELFGGYSFFYPGANLQARNPGALAYLSIRQESNPRGAGGSLTYNFNRWLGLTGDFSAHWGSGETGLSRVDDSGFYNFSIGPKLTLRRKHFAPFVEGLVGWHRLSSDAFGSNDHIGFMVGGGLDIPLNRHFGLRLIQGDYVISNHQFTTNVPTTEIRGARLQTGVVFMFGGAPPPPPMAMSCSAAQPAAVMAGEPVSVTAGVTNVPPKHTLAYAWKSTGGKVTGSGTSATVDTAGLEPGNYTVTATATDSKPKKEQGPLTCSSSFTVNEPPRHSPTASCSANPTTARAGDTSSITVAAGNPDNRPLTYNYTTSAGRVVGNGASATLDTAGANAGPITITATVSDDRGLTANCTATVNVEVPPAPPQASNIGQCTFEKDKKRPWRVDNACKAVLDEVALRLQREPDSKLVVVGHSDPAVDKTNAGNYAAQRAVNSKEYLSGGEAKQQIDPSRLEVRTGAQNGQTAEYWLVPSGATFNQADTQPVDENAVKAPAKKPAHKKAAKTPPATQ